MARSADRAIVVSVEYDCEFALRLRQVVAIIVHNFVPCGGEGFYERFRGVATSIAFSDGAELGVRAEDEINAGAGPFYVTGCAVATFEEPRSWSGLPLGFHVEQVDEEIVRESFRTIGKHAVLGFPEVCVESAEATDENGHFGRRELQ
jgi:hypothetical protein